MISNLIHSIEISNFMCHSYLKLDFTKPITCIGGSNGSGKSAIMIALGLVFGQKALNMDRGTYKSLIKIGKNQSILRVILNNINNINKYNDQIIIEKRIKINNSVSIYSNINNNKILKNINNNVLNNILNDLKIDFSNPLNFLTQENSKKLLNLLNNKKLYDFYYVGTQFKKITDELQKSNEFFNEILFKYKNSNDKIENLSNKLNFDQNNLKLKNINFDQFLTNLLNDKKILYLKNNVGNINNIDININIINNHIINFNNDSHYCENCKKILILKNNSCLSCLIKNCNNDYNNINEKKNDKLKIYYEIKDDIVDQEKDLAGKKEQYSFIKNNDNKNLLINEKKNINLEVTQIKEKIQNLENNKKAIENDYNKEKEENEEIKKLKFNYSKQIDYLEKNKIDEKLKIRNDQIIKIKNKISKAKFKDKVLGPVSDYLKLKDKKWYKPASIILKKTINNFIAFNKEDRETLLNIFNDLNINYPICLFSSKTAIKYTKTHSYKTLLDVFLINSEIVQSLLILLNNADKILLLEDRKEAYEIISKKNISDTAYLISGDRIKITKGSLSDSREKVNNFYFEDKNSKIENLKQNLNKLKEKNDFIGKNTVLSLEINENSNKIQILQNKVEEIENKILSHEKYQSNDVLQIEKKIKASEIILNSLKTKIQKIEEELKEQNKDLEIKLEEIKTLKNKYEEEVNLNNKKIKENDLELGLKKNQIKKLNNEKEEIKEKIMKIKEELKNDLEIDLFIDFVKNHKIEKTLDQINEEIVFYKQKSFESEQIPCKEELEKNIEKYKEEIEKLRKLTSKFKETLEITKEGIEKREILKEEIKRKKTEEAKASFSQYTKKSSYSGDLVFNHKEKTLEIKMETHENEKLKIENTGKSSSLSGGERSFASICFLMSLWKSFTCPIKVLDEFDVFMDLINRKNAITLLFDFIKEEKVQLILITPLDLTDFRDENCEVKILKK